MAKVKPLSTDKLRRNCDPAALPFDSTADLKLEEVPTLGWERALEAADFGIEIDRKGYNLFASGSSGLGKRTTVMRLLEKRAAGEAPPSDWCYVNNFNDESQPLAIELPAGKGVRLKEAMTELLSELRSAIPAVFESEDYHTRLQLIQQEVEDKKEHAFEDLHKEAQEMGLALLRTPMGLAFAPVKDGEVIAPQDYQQLSPEARKKYEEAIQKMQSKLQPILWQIPLWEKAGREKIKQLNREMTLFASGHLIEALRKEFEEVPAVEGFLDEVEEAVSLNPVRFLKKSGEEEAAGNLPAQGNREHFFRRFQVNLVVDHSQNHGAPVIYEDNPNYPNLIGTVEHRAAFGALSTDFTLIRPGSLHRANGGYLVLDALKVLQQPYAWEALKRVIRTEELTIEPLGQALSLITTTSLKPQPIPLGMKVVLLGTPYVHYMLSAYDPEFDELFKVLVDFNDDANRNPESETTMARLIGSLGQSEELHPLDRSGVARLIDHTARLAGDSGKLSTHLGEIRDLLVESEHFARHDGQSVIKATDVQRAIDAQQRRSDRYREYLFEQLERGTILVDTEGETSGQINGLSVLRMGRGLFGRPNRITARVRQGKGVVVDIEREVDLGGPIHSKGVLILSSFLGARYLPDRPLSLKASLVFEQSYSGVDGDSASCAELLALLSALAEAPIKQSLAITGSVNQFGAVQAIGGVNEKIEGFFALCQIRGLTGNQGVVIPASNVPNLMLRQEVVEACQEAQFHIFPIETIDQGIELLTGVPAGERSEGGEFEEGTINARVEARLKAFAKPPKEKSNGDDKEEEKDSDNDGE